MRLCLDSSHSDECFHVRTQILSDKKQLDMSSLSILLVLWKLNVLRLTTLFNALSGWQIIIVDTIEYMCVQVIAESFALRLGVRLLRHAAGLLGDGQGRHVLLDFRLEFDILVFFLDCCVSFLLPRWMTRVSFYHLTDLKYWTISIHPVES